MEEMKAEIIMEFMKQINHQMKQMNDKMELMNHRFDKIDVDLFYLKEDVSVLKEDVKSIKETTTNNLIEARSYFQYVESQLEDQQNVLRVVENGFKKVNIDIDYLSKEVGKHDKDIFSIDKRIQP